MEIEHVRCVCTVEYVCLCCQGECRCATVHVDYPHRPGALYDCPACENECFCENSLEYSKCVFCASLEEMR